MKIDISKYFDKIDDAEIVSFVNDWATETYGQALIVGDVDVRRNKASGMIAVNYEGDKYVEELDTYAQTVLLSKTDARLSDETLDGAAFELAWRKFLAAKIPNYLEFFKKERFNAIGERVSKERLAIEAECRALEQALGEIAESNR